MGNIINYKLNQTTANYISKVLNFIEEFNIPELNYNINDEVVGLYHMPHNISESISLLISVLKNYPYSYVLHKDHLVLKWFNKCDDVILKYDDNIEVFDVLIDSINNIHLDLYVDTANARIFNIFTFFDTERVFNDINNTKVDYIRYKINQVKCSINLPQCLINIIVCYIDLPTLNLIAVKDRLIDTLSHISIKPPKDEFNI
jgi:hypothetical protein